jgi:uncharacterized protein (DUF58 family)
VTPADPTAARLRALALASRAERLAWIARAVTAGTTVGVHRSRLRGEGTEFAEHKPYTPGDDTRQIDWRALARSDRLVVRRFENQREVAAELLIDHSRSMEFGTVEVADDALDVPATKSEAAAMAGAVIGHALLRQGDRVTVTRVGQQARSAPPRSGEAQLPALCTDLAAVVPAEAPGADLAGALAAATARLRGAGLLVVVSDALTEDEDWIRRLIEAQARGHDAMLLHVIDPAERDLPYRDPARFVDPEGGREVRAHPGRVGRRYRALFHEFVEGLHRRLREAGVRVGTLPTGQPLRRTLAPVLAGGNGR